MDIKIAREVAARIWCDQEMSTVVMDVELAEDVAQLLASRLTPLASDVACTCAYNRDGSIMVYSKTCPDPSHAAKA